MGTSVGTKVFLKYGWRAGAALNMGFYAFQLCVHLARGPHCERFTWVGYEGGLEARKKVVDERMRRKQEEGAVAVAAGEKMRGGDDEKEVGLNGGSGSEGKAGKQDGA
jgi:hypothetical protein